MVRAGKGRDPKWLEGVWALWGKGQGMLPWNPALKEPQGSQYEGQGFEKKDGGSETRCEERRRKCMWRKERGRGLWHQGKLAWGVVGGPAGKEPGKAGLGAVTAALVM